MARTIIDVDYKKACTFFLREDSYITFDLPAYYSFSSVLEGLANELSLRPLDIQTLYNAYSEENVNYILFDNKNEKCSWRKLQIINPVLYVYLVQQITKEKNWSLITSRLQELNNETNKITCASIPVFVEGDDKQTAEQIKVWKNKVERESVRLALDFEYLTKTDISSCYGSIYTHALAWSLHTKEYMKTKKNQVKNNLIGNVIDRSMMAMSHGQTNGIPEGSILSDFLAEIMLAYIDDKIMLRIKKHPENQLNDYRIIRYRDDYRIFTHNSVFGEKILQILSEELSSFSMHLNTVKTEVSSDVIISSIKSDKLFFDKYPSQIYLTENSLEKQLLLLVQSSKRFPNSGAVKKRIVQLRKKYECNMFILKRPHFITSLLIDIAINNPKTVQDVVVVISKIIKKMSSKRRRILIRKVCRKIKLMPNTGLLDIWMQRLLIKYQDKVKFSDGLCRYVSGEKNDIFNMSWLSNDNLSKIVSKSYVKKQIINNLDIDIGIEETRKFKGSIDS